MIRIWRWDGKELFINPQHIMYIELMEKYTSVAMVSGPTLSLSESSYAILSGHIYQPSNTPGKPGFEVL